MADDASGWWVTRRRVLGGLTVSGVAAIGASGGTLAAANQIGTGSISGDSGGPLDLEIEAVGLGYTVQNAEPGGSGSDGFAVELSSVGSQNADHLEIDFVNSEHEDDDGNMRTGLDTGPESDPVDGASGLAGFIEVERLEYEETSGTVTVTLADLVDANGNGFLDLQDLTVAPNPSVLDDLDPPSVRHPTRFELRVSVHASLPNDYQGDVLETDVVFTLQQAPSQDR